MRIFKGYTKAKGKFTNAAIGIGVFDGLHLGHKKIIDKLKKVAGTDRDKVVVTFDPNPKRVVIKTHKVQRLMSLDHRLCLLQEMGVCRIVVVNFTKYIASLKAEEFIKKVLLPLGAKDIVVGENFHFGSGKSGNTSIFKELGKKYGFKVHVVKLAKRNGDILSSTKVRELVSQGDINKASKILGRKVSVMGTVVKGDQRGRELGFPTANVDPHQEVVPPPGVYAVNAVIKNKTYKGVLNIGFRPTFYGHQPNKRQEPVLEVHLLSKPGNLYGQQIELLFIKKIRDERKFDTQDQLIIQIQQDVVYAQKNIATDCEERSDEAI